MDKNGTTLTTIRSPGLASVFGCAFAFAIAAAIPDPARAEPPKEQGQEAKPGKEGKEGKEGRENRPDKPEKEKPGKPERRSVEIADLPADAVEAVLSRFPGGEILSATQSRSGAYSIQVRIAAGTAEAEIGADGKPAKFSEPVAAEELPAAVRDALGRDYAGAEIRSVRRETAGDGTVSYQVKTDRPGPPIRATKEGVLSRPGKWGRPGGEGEGRPGGPGEGRGKGRAFTGKGFAEAEWRGWLERVAAAAEMTDEQRTKAAGLLALAEEAAAVHRKAHEADYARIAKALAAAGADEGAAGKEAADALAREAAQLAAPIDTIGGRWRADVLDLLTPAQRKAAGRIADKAGEPRKK
jgi:hypothetical protein